MKNKGFDCLIRHKKNVLENCLRIAEVEEEKGNVDFAKELVMNGFNHDYTKFKNPEWPILITDKDLQDPKAIKGAVKHHNHCNLHHPESWKSIHEMRDVYVAEMVSDWKSRSTEFGSDFFKWIKEEATKRYGFTEDDRVYRVIMYYAEMLVEPAFKPLG